MLIHGDSKEELKNLEDNSVDLLCTDPPYGYSFMGKAWDKALPDIEIFKECLRVLKPGAFAFVMSAPRSDVCSRMAILLEDAGFRIDFTPIYWTYASGFPKAMNIGKMVDKRMGAERLVKGFESKHINRPQTDNWKKSAQPIENGIFTTADGGGLQAITEPATDEAKALDGSYGGFQPKPAVEVIIVAMKPLSEKTYVDQALKNGKGITWLDDCRVGKEGARFNGRSVDSDIYGKYGTSKPAEVYDKGRFPANLIISDNILDKRVDGVTAHDRLQTDGEGSTPSIPTNYSRFFSLDAWAQTLPFLAVPKASKSEKNKGLEGLPKGPPPASARTKPAEGRQNALGELRANHHPTVKPLKLMSYLITLGSRPGDTGLDPFCGSGTTIVAAKELGRQSIGIEREEEYVAIAGARLQAIIPTLL